MIRIKSRKIGPEHPCYIIAEAGVNHNGDFKLAHKMVDYAVRAGADAIKFQTFKTDALVTRSADKALYQKETSGVSGSQYDLIRNLELTYEEFRELHDYSQSKNIQFLSTPFDFSSVDFLDEIGIPLFKIPSGEINNFPLLKYIAKKHKPIILSTGMSTLGEVDAALRCIESEGCKKIFLLHCVTDYPAQIEDVNLKAMETMRYAFKYPVGFSDHTQGITIPVAAVAMGACVLEKHFTLNKTLPGPDHQASLNPQELKDMIAAIRNVEKAFGNGRKKPTSHEVENKKTIRRSIVAITDISKNTIITQDQVSTKRPGSGIDPTYLQVLIGSRATRKIRKNEIISWGDVSLKRCNEE